MSSPVKKKKSSAISSPKSIKEKNAGPKTRCNTTNPNALGWGKHTSPRAPLIGCHWYHHRRPPGRREAAMDPTTPSLPPSSADESTRQRPTPLANPSILARTKPNTSSYNYTRRWSSRFPPRRNTEQAARGGNRSDWRRKRRSLLFTSLDYYSEGKGALSHHSNSFLYLNSINFKSATKLCSRAY